ncbi:hypothetical protein QZH41_016709 [Actinostola sp. cb2023]|nr:hypothetical protein QZH41_016709 [Actinostola sp. cb2023]
MMANNVINGQIILEEEYDETYEPTENEVYEYAQLIGIDPQTEKSLLWIAREGIVAPLPTDWKPCQDSQGDIYYFNFGTGESVWDHPCDEYYRTMVLEERAKKKKMGSGAKKDKKKDKKENKKAKTLDPPSKQKGGLGLSPLKGEGPLGSLGSLAPLKSASPAPLGTSMNSSLGGSSFGVDSLGGSLGGSLGVPKSSLGGTGGSRFSSSLTSNPFQQKVLGNIKNIDEETKIALKQDSMESSNEHDPVIINLNTSLGDNINLNLMADSDSEEDLQFQSPDSKKATFDFGAHDIAALGYEESDIEESSNLKQPNTPSISDMDDGEEVDFGINPTLSDKLEGMSADTAELQVSHNDDDRGMRAKIQAEAAERYRIILSACVEVSRFDFFFFLRRAASLKGDSTVEQEQEKLVDEAAKTLKHLRETMEIEIEEAKQKLQKEKQESLDKLRHKLELEEENEEDRLKDEHDAVMKTLGAQAKEDALEEEAMLQEGKQDAMRKLRQEIQREQDEEETRLRKEKQESIYHITDELEEEQEQIELNLHQEQQKSLKNLRVKLAAEYEEKKKEFDEGHRVSLEEIKEKLDKGRDLTIDKIQQENEYELQQKKNELIEKHEKAMEDVLSELDQVQTVELDDNHKALSRARASFDEQMDSLDAEMQDDFLKKKTDLESKYDKHLESVKTECEKKLFRLKQEWKEQAKQYELTEQWDEEKENLIKEHDEIMSELRNECEAKRKMLQEDWESLSSNLTAEKGELDKQRKDQDKLRKQLLNDKQELEEQASEMEVKRRLKELTVERENVIKQNIAEPAKLAETTSELKELEARLNQSKKDVQKLEKLKTKLRDEIDKLTETKDQLQSSIEDMRSRYQKMQQNYKRQEQEFNEIKKKQDLLEAKLDEMNVDIDLDDTLVDEEDEHAIPVGKHSIKARSTGGRNNKKEVLYLEDLEPKGVSAARRDNREPSKLGKTQRKGPTLSDSELSDSPGEISPLAHSRNAALNKQMWQPHTSKAHSSKTYQIDLSSDESSQDELQQNLLLLQKQAEYRNAPLDSSRTRTNDDDDMPLSLSRDLKKRLVAESDAISKAKRFLRRHKKSVQKRQAALTQARSEWNHDVTTNINRGKPVSSKNATFLEDVKSKLEEEEAELTIVVDNMNVGQELLRQKEERLKILENALLGGLSTTASESDDLPMDHLYRLPRDKYLPHRTTRKTLDDEDSSGFSSSDYGDVGTKGRDVRMSRGAKGLRFANPTKSHNIDDVQSSLSTINTDLARILALLQSQALQRPSLSTRPVYASPEQQPAIFAQTTRLPSSGYTTAPVEHAQTSRPEMNGYHQSLYKPQETAESVLERKWQSYFGGHSRDSPSSLSLGATLQGHITPSTGPGIMKERLTDWTSEGQLNVAERLQNHADWLKNFRREMGLESPGQSSRVSMATTAR